MTTDELLDILADRNVTVTCQGDQLNYSGPKDAVTPALLRVLRLHKPKLLDRLGGTPAAAAETAPEPEPRVMIGLLWPGQEQPYKLVTVDEYFAMGGGYA